MTNKNNGKKKMGAMMADNHGKLLGLYDELSSFLTVETIKSHGNKALYLPIIQIRQTLLILTDEEKIGVISFYVCPKVVCFPHGAFEEGETSYDGRKWGR